MADVREQSAERIEQTATKLFADRGFDAVSVRDIARAAQVPVSAINYYFGSKEALYRECARKLAQQYVAEARARLDAGEGLRGVLEHYLDFAAGNVRLIKMWLDLQLSGDADAQAYSNREILGPVSRVLLDALASSGEMSIDRRLQMLSFVGAVVLGAILTDEQMESLTETQAEAARGRWRDEILRRL
ncbi:MAG: TetR/AcrR family transcriptional regulator [Deltaproteobacteria bacterium]|nr:TetR/AcrR family transcriptional regulator [Deltaproteobacteria bacterium]